MNIKILRELNKELTSLCLSGSSIAKNNKKIRQYIKLLKDFEEEAAIFKLLVSNLDSLIDEEKNSPEMLMETLVIVTSILKIQGNVNPKDFNKKIRFSGKEANFNNISPKKLKVVKDNILFNINGLGKDIKDLYVLNLYDDVRLYDYYIKGIQENNFTISNYLEEVIIPNISEDIVPFLKKILNIKGKKRDAKLYKLLYGKIGEDIVPLSLKVLKEGSPLLVAEALYTLSGDKKYEETFLFYAIEDKGEVKKAAFTSLMKIGSKEGEKLLINELEKIKIGHLYEAIETTNSSEVINAVISEIGLCLKNDSDKIKTKKSSLMYSLVNNPNKEALNFTKLIFREREKYKKYIEIIGERNILLAVKEHKTKESNEWLYSVLENNEYTDIRLEVEFRLFSEEEFLRRRCEEKSKYVCDKVKELLMKKYNIRKDYEFSEDEKKWDRRWVEYFLDRDCSEDVDLFIRSTDEKSLSRLLNICVYGIRIKKNDRHKELGYFGYHRVLAKAFKYKHPKAQEYYEKFSENGYKKENLRNNLKAYGVIIK